MFYDFGYVQWPAESFFFAMASEFLQGYIATGQTSQYILSFVKMERPLLAFHRFRLSLSGWIWANNTIITEENAKTHFARLTNNSEIDCAKWVLAFSSVIIVLFAQIHPLRLSRNLWNAKRGRSIFTKERMYWLVWPVAIYPCRNSEAIAKKNDSAGHCT
jgi:hypothetical protein